MRFKLEASNRRDGDSKIVKKFALFPKIVDNGKTLVWLEPYWVEYRWRCWNSPKLKDDWQVSKIYSLFYEKPDKEYLNSLYGKLPKRTGIKY